MNYIEKAGYGQYFTHGTGHGLGIDVHELPSVDSKLKVMFLNQEWLLLLSQVIYIEGLGGARNEDDVLIKTDVLFSQTERNKNQF